MALEGTWAISSKNSYFEEQGTEWDWFPVPSYNGDVSFSIGVGNGFAINNFSKYPDVVADILDLYYSPDVQVDFLAGPSGKAPGPIAIPPHLLERADPKQAKILATINDAFASDRFGYTAWTFMGAKSNHYLIEGVEGVWADDLTAEEYLEEINTLYAEELEKGEVPPAPVK